MFTPRLLRIITLMLIGLCLPLSATTRNITAYGAIPNDAASDLSAITAAINAAAAGDTVYFPAGTYNVTGSFSPKNGIKIIGTAQGTSVIRFTGTSEGGFIELDSKSNVEIGCLTLDGNNSGSCAYAISSNASSRLFLHHLIIRDMGNFGDGQAAISFHANVTHSRIADNQISNIGPSTVWGGGIRCSWGSSHDTIVRNTISNTGRGGIFGNDGSKGLVIRNNRVSRSGGEGLGIEVWGECDSAIIEDNHIDHWLSIDNSSFCAVRRDTISDTSGVFKFIGLELAEGVNNVYTDNLVDNGQHIGISVSNIGPKRFVFWGYNTVRRMSTWGIQLQGEDSGAAQHFFFRNKFNEMPYNAPYAAYANQGHGFRFNDHCTNITLEENEINANGGLGIQLSDLNNQLSFINNTITGNGDASIETPAAGITDLEWSGNTVSGNETNRQLTSRGFANKKPRADFTVPSQIVAGQAVAFTNTSTDTDGTITNILWDFNHGHPATALNPAHVFDSAGSYRVTLLVWDNQGRGAHQEKTITVVRAGTATQLTDGTPLQGLSLRLAPNPMRNGTLAAFRLPQAGYVTLQVFDIAGHRLCDLVRTQKEAGSHSVTWNGRNAQGRASANGLYFIRLKTAQGTAQRAVLLQR